MEQNRFVQSYKDDSQAENSMVLFPPDHSLWMIFRMNLGTSKGCNFVAGSIYG
ncbi:hypothetical protein SAMN02746065_10278 [Desulfocicer vacuolatum DSM 3385]|uniref:Uncharacterized protein n=1 Tax=Desulfocicer vacuolatum DSM 3385 TaxID=1121400 RepID=A0A1W1Z4N3_9BACT|nr:hypothetical protein SAMN02746065_10278 [Desulfocicer vacuolatum DSM 3385]